MAPTMVKADLMEVEGVLYPTVFDEDCIRETLSYVPKPDDVFIVTYPKCGTTWTEMIMMHILRKGEPFDKDTDFIQHCPYLELTGVEILQTMLKPGILKTHLPFASNPYCPETKYVTVSRNPKDCCVSLYYHSISMPGLYDCEVTFDDFFELFMAGRVFYGDYFEHTLSWVEHYNDTNVLFMTYEEMKRDTRRAVVKIAKFLGKEYGEMLEKDPSVMDNILLYSSLKYMKEHTNKVFDIFNHFLDEDFVMDPTLPKGLKRFGEKARQIKLVQKPKLLTLVRKGAVGDWRNYFSLEQSERMNQRFAETLGHTVLADLWREDMKYHPSS